MVQHLVMELNIYLFPPPDKKRLWYRDEHKEHKLWFEVDTEVISLKAFSKSSQTGEKEARAHLNFDGYWCPQRALTEVKLCIFPRF